MLIKDRIKALAEWGKNLRQDDSEALQQVIHKTYLHNGWFTKDNIQHALDAIVDNYLNEAVLEQFALQYPSLNNASTSKEIAIVMAGNIPLVGFHDLLCVLISGHRAQLKLSSKDQFLLPYLIDRLQQSSPGFQDHITYASTLKGFDAIIATGSDNSARYFHYYFGKYPHIIRKNRHSVGVLDGKESSEELEQLGQDIFQYFGLGCRNVSKLYLPKGYDFEPIFEALKIYAALMDHSKYRHNYDYNFAVWMMNKVPFLTNDIVMLAEQQQMASPIATLFYEYYDNPKDLKTRLMDQKDQIQCMVASTTVALAHDFNGSSITAPGHTQHPALWDFADGVDTMQFLLGL